MDILVDPLRDFITIKDVTVVELDEIKTSHERFKSFRLCVKRSDPDKIEDAEFWPQGIVVCRYFRPRVKDQPGVVGEVTVSPETNNGVQQG